MGFVSGNASVAASMNQSVAASTIADGNSSSAAWWTLSDCRLITNDYDFPEYFILEGIDDMATVSNHDNNNDRMGFIGGVTSSPKITAGGFHSEVSHRPGRKMTRKRLFDIQNHSKLEQSAPHVTDSHDLQQGQFDASIEKPGNQHMLRKRTMKYPMFL